MPFWMDRPADMTGEAEVRYAHISHSDRPKVRRGGGEGGGEAEGPIWIFDQS